MHVFVWTGGRKPHSGGDDPAVGHFGAADSWGAGATAAPLGKWPQAQSVPTAVGRSGPRQRPQRQTLSEAACGGRHVCSIMARIGHVWIPLRSPKASQCRVESAETNPAPAVMQHSPRGAGLRRPNPPTLNANKADRVTLVLKDNRSRDRSRHLIWTSSLPLAPGCDNGDGGLI